MDSKKLTVRDFVYISTLSDLGVTSRHYGSSMLKLDVSPGDYGLLEFHGGYVLAKYGYYPDFKDMIKIFCARLGHKGLSGTDYCGGTSNENHMRLFNDWLRFHLHEDYARNLYYYSDAESNVILWPDELDGGMEYNIITPPQDYACKRRLTELKDYHNLPVIFYLNRCLHNDDLYQLFLKCPMNRKIGNVQRVWRVVHDGYGDVGVAVQQDKLYNLLGEQAGLAFFATTTAQAFGNFDLQSIYNENMFIGEWVSYPHYQLNCKFYSCNCDWRYN